MNDQQNQTLITGSVKGPVNMSICLSMQTEQNIFKPYDKWDNDHAVTINRGSAMGLKGFLLVNSFLLLGLTSAQECCQKKVVTEPAEHAGTFTFVRKFNGDKDSNCADACIYSKDGADGEEYCFKAVDEDPATIDDQCDATPNPKPTSGAPTRPTSAPPTGTTTVDIGKEIEEKNKEIEANNEKINVEQEKSNTASSASAVVDGIASALASGRKKRQSESSTVAPLASITKCSEFDAKFKELLSNLKQLDGDNADDKIPLIKELIRILNEALPKLSILCDADEKKKLKEETSSDVQTAKEKTTKYKEKKEKKIKDLVYEVQIAKQQIGIYNEKLEESGSSTIPAKTLNPDYNNYTVSITTQQTTPPIGSSSSPGGSSSGDSSPGGTSPEVTSPGGSSKDGSSPDSTSPGGTSPEGTSPGGTSPGDSSPGGSSPGGSSPSGSSTGGTSPGGLSQGSTNPSSSPDTSQQPPTTRGPGRLNKHFKDFKKFHH